MCLFSRPRRRTYVEEVYVAPRPVSRHSHRSHHHGRTSYTSVTRTSQAVSPVVVPRLSQSTYRQYSTPVPVVVQERRSTTRYR